MQGCGSQFFPTNTETFSWLLRLCCPEGRNPGTKRGQHASLLRPQTLPRWLQVQRGAKWRKSSKVLPPGTRCPMTPELRDGEEQ